MSRLFDFSHLYELIRSLCVDSLVIRRKLTAVYLVILSFSSFEIVNTAHANPICTDQFAPEPLKPERYQIDGPGLTYERTFSRLFTRIGITNTESFFQDFVRNRRSEGNPAHVLDLMGSAFFISDASQPASLTGLRFAPFRYDSTEDANLLSSQRVEVYGDIFSDAPWNALRQSMSIRGIQKMDLITMRPIGGWPIDSSGYTRANFEVRRLINVLDQIRTTIGSQSMVFIEIRVPQLKAEDGTVLPDDKQTLENNPLLQRWIENFEAQTGMRVLTQHRYLTGSDRNMILDFHRPNIFTLAIAPN